MIEEEKGKVENLGEEDTWKDVGAGLKIGLGRGGGEAGKKMREARVEKLSQSKH